MMLGEYEINVLLDGTDSFPLRNYSSSPKLTKCIGPWSSPV